MCLGNCILTCTAAALRHVVVFDVFSGLVRTCAADTQRVHHTCPTWVIRLAHVLSVGAEMVSSNLAECNAKVLSVTMLVQLGVSYCGITLLMIEQTLLSWIKG